MANDYLAISYKNATADSLESWLHTLKLKSQAIIFTP